MESIKQIYRIGHGPSSSHTMGPMRAARMFLERNRGAVRFNVTLYGSLAATGKGHMTDAAILEVLSPVAKTNITWEPKVFLPFHPNGILFQSFDESGEELDNWTIYSIGGGTLANETYNELTQGQVYEMHTIKDIQAWCEKTGHSYWEYVEQCEGPQIWDYLAEVWEVMQQAVRNGLEAEGILPGGLGIRRKASDYMIRAKGYGSSIKSRGMVYAYALAVSEENACGGKIVTAPTCGSCGVMPAVLYHLKETGVTGTGKQHWTRRELNRFCEEYIRLFGDNQSVPLTYHPIYIIAKKRSLSPDPSPKGGEEENVL